MLKIFTKNGRVEDYTAEGKIKFSQGGAETRDDAGKDVVVLLAMTLGTTPESEATQRALADEQGRPVLWAHSYGPLICWTLGGLLLLLGTVLTVMRARERRAQEDFPDELATFDDLRDTSD